MVHFYDDAPESIAKLEVRDAVERYAADAGVPLEAIFGLDSEQLRSRPVEGTWSIQEIVVHLMDTDLIAAYRMKRIIAEDQPTWDTYDENAFAARLFYNEVDAVTAAEVFRLNRRCFSSILRKLPVGAFDRIAHHPDIGEVSLSHLLRLYIHHLEHHMRFLRKKRLMVE